MLCNFSNTCRLPTLFPHLSALLPLPIFFFFLHSHFLSTARLDLWLPLTLVAAASSHQHSNLLIFITQLLASSCESILENKTSHFSTLASVSGPHQMPQVLQLHWKKCGVADKRLLWSHGGHVAAPLSAFRSSFSDSCRCDSALSKIPQTCFWDKIPEKSRKDFEGR